MNEGRRRTSRSTKRRVHEANGRRFFVKDEIRNIRKTIFLVARDGKRKINENESKIKARSFFVLELLPFTSSLCFCDTPFRLPSRRIPLNRLSGDLSRKTCYTLPPPECLEGERNSRNMC
jgi:hypothetical protein